VIFSWIVFKRRRSVTVIEEHAKGLWYKFFSLKSKHRLLVDWEASKDLESRLEAYMSRYILLCYSDTISPKLYSFDAIQNHVFDMLRRTYPLFIKSEAAAKVRGNFILSS
jgi:hypothetical protein